MISRSVRPRALWTAPRAYRIADLTMKKVYNNNLRFETDNYTLNLFTNYPEVYWRGGTTNEYHVSSTCSVLGIFFMQKGLDYSEAWTKRRGISLNFKKMGYLLEVEPGKGKTVELESEASSKTDYIKVLKVTDHPKQEKVEFHLREYDEGAGMKRLLVGTVAHQTSALMHYSQYQVMYNLLERSLVDLSGLRFMLQLQKRRVLANKNSNRGQLQELNELAD